MPAMVASAEAKDLNPIIGRVILLMPFELLAFMDPTYVLSEKNYGIYQTSGEYKKEPKTENEWREYLSCEMQKFNGYLPFNLFHNKYYGMFSLCNSPLNTLMWSYYASSHTGVCVRFRMHEELREIIESETDKVTLGKYDIGPAFIFGKMSYDPHPFILTEKTDKDYQREYDDIFLHTTSPIKISKEDLIAIKSMLTKHKGWQHEEEYRLITLGLVEKIDIPSLTYPNTEECLLKPDAIIFGLRTSNEARKVIQNSFAEKLSYFETDISCGTYNLYIKPYSTS